MKARKILVSAISKPQQMKLYLKLFISGLSDQKKNHSEREREESVFIKCCFLGIKNAFGGAGRSCTARQQPALLVRAKTAFCDLTCVLFLVRGWKHLWCAMTFLSVLIMRLTFPQRTSRLWLTGGWWKGLSPLCATPAAELQQHRILRGSPAGASGLGRRRVANSAAAVPQRQVPFTWREKGRDTAFHVIEIQHAWEPFSAFSNLSEKASLQGSFCNPTRAKNAFTEARPAQHRRSSREYGKQHKRWKVSKKLVLLLTPVIPSPVLFKPQIHSVFPR